MQVQIEDSGLHLAHAAHEGEQASIDGPDAARRPKAAEWISLALHELTTNAVKHGVLAGANGGGINVGWKLNGDGTALHFEWTERGLDGRGPPKPARQGFGMELLTRILTYDLDARTAVEFGPEGMRFSMELPLQHVMERPSHEAGVTTEEEPAE